MFQSPDADNQSVKRSPFAFGVVLTAALVIVPACSMPTQVTPSTGPWSFSGTVFARDDAKVGAPIAGAKLTLTRDDEVRARATSDTTGRYVFNEVEAGRFRLTISAPGFATLTPSVDLDRNLQADFAMKRE
jgi:hypothetical protein